MSKFKKDIKRLATRRNGLIVLIIFLVAVFWFKYLAGLVLLGIFIPVTFITVRYSKMVPHVSIESNTAMTFFIGYTFGPIYALIYGPIVGISCYVINSFVSPAYMSTPIIAGIAGAVVGLLGNSFGLGFTSAFFIGLLIRTLIATPWFLLFTDPVEVITHQTTQFLSNLILYLPLLSALYDLVSPIL